MMVKDRTNPMVMDFLKLQIREHPHSSSTTSNSCTGNFSSNHYGSKKNIGASIMGTLTL